MMGCNYVLFGIVSTVFIYVDMHSSCRSGPHSSRVKTLYSSNIVVCLEFEVAGTLSWDEGVSNILTTVVQ